LWGASNAYVVSGGLPLPTIATAPDVERLLTRGLLPENIPSAFTASSLAPLYAPYSAMYMITAPCIGDLARFNASKRGGQRRVFGIPHPSFIHDAAVFFSKNWSDVDARLSSSKVSASKPNFR
jgi:hypothetical protein